MADYSAARVQLIDLIGRGGPPAVIVAIMTAAALAAWLIWRLPAIARPLAAALQMVRRGTTERELQLEQHVGELQRENSELRSMVRLLEHRLEEVVRTFGALADHLVRRLEETQDQQDGTADLILMIKTLIADPVRPDHANSVNSSPPTGAP